MRGRTTAIFAFAAGAASSRSWDRVSSIGCKTSEGVAFEPPEPLGLFREGSQGIVHKRHCGRLKTTSNRNQKIHMVSCLFG